MENGTISGNEAKIYGGGVYVEEGTFIMNGGTISGNTAPEGGGVYVGTDGIFIMNKGAIYGTNNPSMTNTVTDPDGGSALYVSGGGKYTIDGISKTVSIGINETFNNTISR